MQATVSSEKIEAERNLLLRKFAGALSVQEPEFHWRRITRDKVKTGSSQPTSTQKLCPQNQPFLAAAEISAEARCQPDLSVATMESRSCAQRSNISDANKRPVPPVLLLFDGEEAKGRKLLSLAQSLDHVLREDRIVQVVLKNQGHEPDRYVTSVELGYDVSGELALADFCQRIGTLRAPMDLQALSEPTRRFLLSNVLRQLERSKILNPNQPLITFYAAILHSMLNGSESVAGELSQFDSFERERQTPAADLATGLKSIVAYITMPNALAPEKLDNALKFLQKNVPVDWFYYTAQRALYEKADQSEKAKLVAQTAWQYMAEPRWSTLILLALTPINLSAALFVVVFGNVFSGVSAVDNLVSDDPSKDRRSPRQDRPSTSIACPVPYGWERATTIFICSILLGFMGLVVLTLIAPQQAGHMRGVLAYFDPFSSALLALAEQFAAFTPVVLLTYILVSRPSGIPFPDFIALRFKTANYPSWQMIALGLGILVVDLSFCWPSMALSLAFQYPPTKYDNIAFLLVLFTHNWLAIAILFLAVAILGPIFEEIVLRGILYRGLRRHWGVTPSVVFSALVFALMHCQPTPWLLFHKFIFGAVAALGVEKTKSIVPSIVAHMLNNGILLLLAVASGICG